jgi:hypothetical protein
MLDCDHEEADTRIVVHVIHALAQGASTVQVRTGDTDVVVILIGKFHDILLLYPQAVIWVAFGMGKDFCFFHINDICASLGKDWSQSLPVFHAMTGCDTTSAFNFKGKKSAWQAWKSYAEATDAFLSLAHHPFMAINISSDVFCKLERLIVILYNKTSPLISVNEARMELFCQRNRNLDRIPPTKVYIVYYIANIKIF